MQPARKVVSAPWYPIETAPKDGTQILVVGARPENEWSGILHSSWQYDRWACWKYPFQPTYWQPLPDFPDFPITIAPE